ncbi:hypothetical protein [uncultured Parabacteroides sp.]|uniref:hypothetical protein n=1 Tax=uncultured Parabacteroides sp. TaxID=512312 RepID=UPI0025F6EDCB|nr:hypothetical protein [uncultured Parabacteroides sp.]
MAIVLDKGADEKTVEGIFPRTGIVADKFVTVETVQPVPSGEPHEAAGVFINIIDRVLGQAVVGRQVGEIIGFGI